MPNPDASSPFPKGTACGSPISFAALAAIGIVLIHQQPELERNHQAWMTASLVLLCFLLGLIWFLFLSRISWRTRGIGLLSLVVVIFGLSRLVRVDGTADGRGLPKFVWRWNVRPVSVPDAALPPVANGALTPAPGVVDVPQYFGAYRDGVVRNVKLARDWNANPPKELWRHPVGAGWSAFAVMGSRAITQEQRAGESEAVTCYDLVTGLPVWIHAYPARFFQWQGGEGPRATPTVDRDRVYAYGATGVLCCLDLATGQLVWSRDVLAENHLENITWGVSASPLVFDDTVVVTGGATSGPTVLAFHRVTGEPLWKSGTDKASYASPILTTLAARQVILSVNAANVTAYVPATGAVLLDFQWTEVIWPKAAQPVILPGDRVFVSAGYGMGALLFEVKADADGKLTATTIWKTVRMKTQFNSAAYCDGYLYGLDDGMLACVDAATGNRKWKDGHYGSGQTLLVDDLAIVQSEAGPVILASANPEKFQQFGQIPALSSKTWNQPTLAGRYLLLRNDREAVCYELAEAP